MQEQLWIVPPEQTIQSRQASINSKKVPAVFSKVDVRLWGSVNADIGGGKYDTGTEFLLSKGTINYIYDPYNRDWISNTGAIASIRDGQCDTATISNVLNVIKEASVRDRIIRQAHNCLKIDGVAFFYIYEGDKTGVGKVSQTEKDGTPSVWQEHRRAVTYCSEIAKHFRLVKREGTLIIARDF